MWLVVQTKPLAHCSLFSQLVRQTPLLQSKPLQAPSPSQAVPGTQVFPGPQTYPVPHCECCVQRTLQTPIERLQAKVPQLASSEQVTAATQLWLASQR